MRNCDLARSTWLCRIITFASAQPFNQRVAGPVLFGHSDDEKPHSAQDGVAPKTCGGLSVQRQSNSRGWLHRAFPCKRHQMRHLCDLTCLLAKQMLSQLSYTPPATI